MGTEPSASAEVDVLANLSGDDLLRLIYALLNHVYSPGQMKGNTDYLELEVPTGQTAPVWQRLYGNTTRQPKPVFAAIIQNLSTDPLTLSFEAPAGWEADDH